MRDLLRSYFLGPRRTTSKPRNEYEVISKVPFHKDTVPPSPKENGTDQSKTQRQRNYDGSRHFCGEKHPEGRDQGEARSSESTGRAREGPATKIFHTSHCYRKRRCGDRSMMPTTDFPDAQTEGDTCERDLSRGCLRRKGVREQGRRQENGKRGCGFNWSLASAVSVSQPDPSGSPGPQVAPELVLPEHSATARGPL